MKYQLKKRSEYRAKFNGSDELFSACWKKYRRDLRRAIDDRDPDISLIIAKNDDDVIGMLDMYRRWTIWQSKHPLVYEQKFGALCLEGMAYI